jgi:hypothetical protein
MGRRAKKAGLAGVLYNAARHAYCHTVAREVCYVHTALCVRDDHCWIALFLYCRVRLSGRT